MIGQVIKLISNVSPKLVDAVKKYLVIVKITFYIFR